MDKCQYEESQPGQTPLTGLPGPDDAGQQDADGGQVWPRVLGIALPGQRLVSLYSCGLGSCLTKVFLACMISYPLYLEFY